MDTCSPIFTQFDNATHTELHLSLFFQDIFKATDKSNHFLSRLRVRDDSMDPACTDNKPVQLPNLVSTVRSVVVVDILFSPHSAKLLTVCISQQECFCSEHPQLLRYLLNILWIPNNLVSSALNFFFPLLITVYRPRKPNTDTHACLTKL